jgi:hypothetical protein
MARAEASFCDSIRGDGNLLLTVGLFEFGRANRQTEDNVHNSLTTVNRTIESILDGVDSTLVVHVRPFLSSASVRD